MLELGSDGNLNLGDRGRRLLVIGGTSDAARLVRGAVSRFGNRLVVVTSLAGRTLEPVSLPGQVRVGGFGGVSGLTKWMVENKIDLVIDATHPFAVQISENTREACEYLGVARLVLGRPQWERQANDVWLSVSDMDEAARLLLDVGIKPLLTVGSGEIVSFSILKAMHVVVRLIDRPVVRLPLVSYDLILDRGPFDLASEEKLFSKHEIDVLVTKNSGGAATYPKIRAARNIQIPVIMIKRPPLVEGEYVEHPDSALSWVEERLL